MRHRGLSGSSMTGRGASSGQWLSSTFTAAQLRSLYICIAYGASSTLISLVYKALLSSYNYKGKFLLLAAQQGVSLLFCLFAKRFLVGRPGFEVPDIKRDQLVDSLWPGLLNVANIVVGWYGLALVSVPLFLCVRRTATAMCVCFYRRCFCLHALTRRPLHSYLPSPTNHDAHTRTGCSSQSTLSARASRTRVCS